MRECTIYIGHQVGEIKEVMLGHTCSLNRETRNAHGFGGGGGANILLCR